VHKSFHNNIARIAILLAACSATLAGSQSCPVSSVASSATPIVLYTDIQSGPLNGGENNKGIYLSIFGKNFGAAGLGTIPKFSSMELR
jgi:hypothetical protein